MKKRRQLKWSMVVMLLVTWFIPLLFFSMIIFLTVDQQVNGQIEDIIVLSADEVVDLCQRRIDDVIIASKNASYLPTVRNSYVSYLTDNDKSQLEQAVTSFMFQQYRYNRDINMTAIYFTFSPEEIYYCYSNNNTVNYSSVRAFRAYAKETVQKHARGLDTDIAFMRIGGRVYLVRNIMDRDFHAYAVIVMELNMEDITEGLSKIWGFKDGNLYVDGESILSAYERDPYIENFPQRIMKNSHFEHNASNSYVYKKVESNRHYFSYVVNIDPTAVASEMDTIKYVFFLLFVFMIPLIGVIFWFFHKRVNVPIYMLRKAYQEIEKENYGYQIGTEDSDEEFYALECAFNSMSSTLKYQFEKNYLEEIALRDANIMALQSQINPHFLNNTLEIINWEARLGGNYKVSTMIEALSTMLEATMNRKKEQLISLAEELSYVEAYLLIIAQRYGEKLSVENEIDDSLLSVKVPRLIIQPIIENAVEHGIDIRRKGEIKLIIRREDQMLLIEVIDNGQLTEESKEKIRKLLQADGTTEISSLSLGIRNVDKRLKIIYGEECGLTIKSNNENHTVSTIMVKIDKGQGQ